MKTILIIEDDNDIHKLLKEILEQQNYKTLNAYSGTEALRLIEKENIDLILLDLMLPGVSGEDIINKVKDIPIIVISAKISQEDKINVLLEGANDYIRKPFNTQELLARIKVQLRINQTNNQNKELKYKDICLDENLHKLVVEEKEIYLTRTEVEIMKQLLLSPKQVIAKTKLLETLGMTGSVECDENSLKVHISNIRKKIKKVTNKECIESVWGIGFKIHE